MSGPIEEVDSSTSRKRKNSTTEWMASYMSGLVDFIDKPIIDNTPATPTKDTISSAEKVGSSTQTQKPPETSSNGLINLGRKVWDFFSAPIIDNTPASEKPGNAGSKGIGTPTLEPPFQIDMKQLAKLIKELQEILKRIVEATFDNEEDIRDAERLIMLWLVDYLKRQKIIREEGAKELKHQVIFHSKKSQDYGKELINTENLHLELAKDQKFWGRVNKIFTWGAVALTVAIVATTILSTAGLAAAPTIGLKVALSVSQSLLGIASGGTQFIKVNLDKKVGEHKEKSINLQEMHSTEVFKIKALTEQMNEGLGKSLMIATWMRQLGDRDRQANLDMISISPPAAPAA